MSTLPPLPQEFLARINAEPALDGLAAALDSPPEVSVRVNRRRIAATLPDPVPWADDGYYLTERPQFTFDPALHQGLYYVQDASSMATACAVRQAAEALGEGRLRLLDACAAPGGKTIGAAEALAPGSLVVANEFSRQRAAVLAENLAKRGIDSLITNNDASTLRGLDGFFDIITADVPCSGEGMMRKEAEARRQWSPQLVTECAALQRTIVDALAEALRPGGFMVYSTCTFNREENEEIVSHLIAEHGFEAVAVNELEKIAGIAGAIGAHFPAYRFLPGRVRGEGLFLALLRKSGNAPAAAVKPAKAAKNISSETASWLADEREFSLRGDVLYALPAAWAAEAAAIAKRMNVVMPGLEVATVKGRDLIPAQPMALSPVLRADAFAHAEVDAATALAYLGRNAIVLPDDAPRGTVLLTHGDHPLGFAKNLGRRANNLYPAPWRILSQSPVPTRVLK